MYRPTNEPNYVARKSTIPAYRWWLILFFVISVGAIAASFLLGLEEKINNIVRIAGIALLALTVLIITCKLIVLKHKYIEFYDSYVVEKWGVFNKHSKKTVFPKIVSVSTNKNILGYGNVNIDVVGPSWDVKFEAIARPNELRDFLRYHMLSEAAIENISNNPYIAATDGVFG
jgi:hypothetical protein